MSDNKVLKLNKQESKIFVEILIKKNTINN